MAELTAESITKIVREEFEAVEKRLSHEFNAKIDELDRKVTGFDDKLEYGIKRVLKTIQQESDERQDQLAGIEGRLKYHNERIAHLERLVKVR